jgi:ParB/RepB/Spo0J family partition protein
MSTTQQNPLFDPPAKTLETISIDSIEPWQTTGRNAVVKSIAAFGVVSAIQVERMPFGHPYDYRVIDGRRRLDAAKKAGIDEIPAIVLPYGGGDTYEALAAGSNLARAFAPIDEAKHLETLVTKGFTPERLSQELGLPLGTVRQRLKLTALPTPVRDAVQSRVVSPSVAAAMANLTPQQTQEAVSRLQQNGALSRDDIAEIRLADKEAALAAAIPLLAPPPPPTAAQIFAIAIRTALGNGMTAQELHAAIDSVAAEMNRA